MSRDEWPPGGRVGEGQPSPRRLANVEKVDPTPPITITASRSRSDRGIASIWLPADVEGGKTPRRR